MKIREGEWGRKRAKGGRVGRREMKIREGEWGRKRDEDKGGRVGEEEI